MYNPSTSVHRIRRIIPNSRIRSLGCGAEHLQQLRTDQTQSRTDDRNTSNFDVLVNEAAPLVADTSLPPITVLVAEAEPIPSKRGQLAVPGNDILPPATVLAEAPPAFSHQPPQPPQQQTRLFTAQQPSGWPGASYPWPSPQTAFPSGPTGPTVCPTTTGLSLLCGTYRHMAGIPPLPLQADVQWLAHDSISRTWTLDGRASFPTAHRASILPWKLDTRASARSYH